LREGADRFDLGFYLTYGAVRGRWRMAKMALSLFEGEEQPRWDLIDQLLDLDDELLYSVLDEGPDDPRDFLLRVSAIMEGAEEAGFRQDISLAALLDKAGGERRLATVEERLPGWQSDHEVRVAQVEAERQQKLLPFAKVLESWPAAAVGPHPGGMNAGMGWSIRKSHIRSYLEQFILAHAELPSGLHDLGRASAKGLGINVGVIDFDQAAQRAVGSAEEQ
jgi:hypothetical protein